MQSSQCAASLQGESVQRKNQKLARMCAIVPVNTNRWRSSLARLLTLTHGHPIRCTLSSCLFFFVVFHFLFVRSISVSENKNASYSYSCSVCLTYSMLHQVNEHFVCGFFCRFLREEEKPNPLSCFGIVLRSK